MRIILKVMTDFDSPPENGMGRSDASCAVCEIMKVSLGDEGDACQSKNAPPHHISTITAYI